MWTFFFLQATTILLVPDFIDIRICVKFSITLVSLVWIFQFIYQCNGSFILVGREVWVVGVWRGGFVKKFCKQIQKHHFCTNVNYVFHVVVIRQNLCANSGSQIAVVTKYLTVEPNICGSSLWQLFVTHLVLRNFGIANRFLENLCTPDS